MKPNKPGEWHSRDGHKIVVYRNPFSGLIFRNDDGSGSDLVNLVGDDWLPAVAPEFPELPPKPYIVLVDRPHVFTKPVWVMIEQGSKKYSRDRGQYGSIDALRVVPHPDNDPAAVRMIEEARKNG